MGKTALPWISDDDLEWMMGKSAHKFWPMLQA
jgi:hypothetical protein